MNALAKIDYAAVEEIPLIDEFAQLCHDYAWFWRSGLLDKADAVDCVQHHAELWGTVDAYGQDEVQRTMADAFREPDALPEPAPPIAPEPERTRGYRTPPATEQAFWFIVRQGDSDRLKAWLAEHPRDVDHLRKIWGAKCTA